VNLVFITIIVVTGGWDISVGIALCYVVVRPTLRPPMGARFSGPMHIFPEKLPVSYTMVAGLFAGSWRLPCTVSVECR
jgi:hypothetical protein